MTRIERVMNAIRHKEGDRVPKGELCIEANIANRLLGKNYPLDYQHYERDKEIRELLNMDLVNLGDWPQEIIGMDERGNRIFRTIYGEEYIYSGKSKHLIKPALDDIEKAEDYPVPDVKKCSGKIISDFARNTDFFILSQIGGPVSMLDEMFGMEDYLVYCMTNTKEMKILGEKVMEYEINKARLFLDSGAHAVVIADDIAYNKGTFLPPAVMEEIVYPFYRIAVEAIKKHRDVPIFFHSDGDIMSAVGRLVECGFDVLHSIQPSAGMDIARLKKEYGDVLCLMGNIDLDYIMTFGTVKEVEEAVKRTIDIAAPGGGYILSTCNTLVDAIPPENALTMYRAADEYGRYK